MNTFNYFFSLFCRCFCLFRWSAVQREIFPSLGLIATGLPVSPRFLRDPRQGSGLVHTAPAHGQDDYLLGLKHGLNCSTCLVDAFGKFTKDAGSDLEGKEVLSDGTKTVMEILNSQGQLLGQSKFSHPYPYDWRTKKPVILRASEQWLSTWVHRNHCTLAKFHFKMIPCLFTQSIYQFHPRPNRICRRTLGQNFEFESLKSFSESVSKKRSCPGSFYFFRLERFTRYRRGSNGKHIHILRSRRKIFREENWKTYEKIKVLDVFDTSAEEVTT